MNCPFCGDEGQVDEIGVSTYPVYAVICQGCGAVGPAREQAEDAARSWDARMPFNGIAAIPPHIRKDPPGMPR